VGRKAFVTREELFEAADVIAAEGQEVTARTLRSYLGGGSFSSIVQYLIEWKALKAEPNTIKMGMPVNVLGAFDTVWQTAIAQASKEVALAKEKAAEEVVAIQARLHEAIAAIEELEDEKNGLAEKVVELADKSLALEGKVLNLSNEKAALAAVNAELKQKSEHAQLAFEKSQQALEKLEAKHAEEIERARDEHAKEVTTLKVDIAKIEAARDAVGEEAKKYLQRLSDEGSEAKERQAKLESKIESSEQAREVAVKEAAELKGQFEALKNQNADLLSRLSGREGKK
jgi:chromosome segregation ATPase